MSLLTYNELVKLVENGAIQGVHPDDINGASIDLTLGPNFLVEEESKAGGVVALKRKERPPMRRVYDKLHLSPGQFCLAQTLETFNLPDDIAAHYMLKSSLARAGLGHLFAGFADPTWNGSVLTLEYKNELEFHHLLLEEGMKAGQMVFFRGSSPVPLERSYAVRGQYNGDKGVQASKGVR